MKLLTKEPLTIEVTALELELLAVAGVITLSLGPDLIYASDTEGEGFTFTDDGIKALDELTTTLMGVSDELAGVTAGATDTE